MAETVSSAPDRLRALVGRLERQEGFSEVVASLQAGHAATLDGVWGSACALALAALVEHAPAPLVAVCPHVDGVDDFIEDLRLFSSRAAERFPAWESLPDDRVLHDEVAGDRTRLLKLLESRDPPKIVVAGIQALLQPVPERESLAQQTRTLRVGEALDVRELVRWLTANGFHNTSAVELPGEISVRGGIVDVFASDWYNPVRIELFGDEIESIRRFEIASQRSLARFDAVDVTLVRRAVKSGGHLADYLPAGSWILLVEPSELQEEGRRYLERLERPQEMHSVTAVMEQVLRFPSIAVWAVAAGSLETTCRLPIESVERFSGDIAKVRQELDAAGAGQEVLVVCQTDAEARRFGALLADTLLAREGRLHFPVGSLTHGFRLVRDRIALVSSGELFHRTDIRRARQRRLGKAIESFVELREGDLVVHVNHGIARYRGMSLLEKDRQVEEHLILEFAEGAKLYVPSSKIGLVQKYVGGSKARPKLAKLGGRAWGRQKAAVEQAVTDMAGDMLDLQAARSARPGIAFPPDTEWQREFDASFPYQETVDQLATIDAVKHDMALRGRWTACCAATWASARRKWPCARLSRPWTPATKRPFSCPPRSWPSSTPGPSPAECPSTPSRSPPFRDSPRASSRRRFSRNWRPARSTSSSARTAWLRRTSGSTISGW